MLENTVGVGDHPTITETIEQELEIISKYDDKLNVLKKYFTDKSFKKNNKKNLNQKNQYKGLIRTKIQWILKMILLKI